MSNLRVKTTIKAGGKCQKRCRKHCDNKGGVSSASTGLMGECWCQCNDDGAVGGHVL